MFKKKSKVKDEAPAVYTPDDSDLYRKHIVYYFDTQLGLDILRLSTRDKFRIFKMMKEYAPELTKLFHPGIDILEHIQGKRFEAANANPHEGINYNHDCPIIKEYDEWNKHQY
jgi:hypothetical protein